VGFYKKKITTKLKPITGIPGIPGIPGILAKMRIQI
jgi:hypothetical protein